MRNKIRKFIKNSKYLSELLQGIFIRLHNYSYHKISEYAGYLHNDIHPKHDILNYHQFFVDRVDENDNVLDIGSGSGFLAFDVAKKAKKVIGIDIQEYNIVDAKKNYQRENLEFIIGDATVYNFEDKFDKIILSNVLEHIEDRVALLKNVKKLSKVILLRVPMINRDWLTVYKKNLGYEYRLDSTHYIEYTVDILKDELQASGWYLDYYQVNWGEIWAVLKVQE